MSTRFGLLVSGLLAALSLPAQAEEVPGLVLETGSPDALCPDLTQTRAAVSRRLGALEVPGRRGFHARYTVGHAPEGSPRDFVRLELFNSEGARELVRDLPMSGESCSTLAEAIALVLERHFRGLSPEEIPAVSSAESSDARTAAAIPPSAGTEPEPAPQRSREAIASTAPSASPAARVHPSGTLLLAEFGFGPARPPMLGLRVMAPLGASFALASALLFDTGYERESLSRGGEARALRAELRGSLAWRFGAAPWFGQLGPSLSLGLQHGETRNITQHSDQWRALWAGGVEAGAGVRVSPHVALALSGAALAAVPAISGRFYVSDEEVLRPSLVALHLGLGAGYIF